MALMKVREGVTKRLGRRRPLEPDAYPQSARPRSPWLRLVAVLMTLSIVCGMALALPGVAEQFGVDPNDLQGTTPVAPSFPTLTLFLVWQALLALVVFASQRVVHRRSFLDLGFRAPALRHLVIGFAAGMAVVAAPLTADLMTGSMSMEWSVPAGVSAVALAGYCCFFLVLLTINSFGEELVFRCYPIEQFRDSQAMMAVAVMVAMVVFAALHFVVAELSLGRFIFMVAFACLYVSVYVYYRSIWLASACTPAPTSSPSFSAATGRRVGFSLFRACPRARSWHCSASLRRSSRCCCFTGSARARRHHPRSRIPPRSTLFSTAAAPWSSRSSLRGCRIAWHPKPGTRVRIS